MAQTKHEFEVGMWATGTPNPYSTPMPGKDDHLLSTLYAQFLKINNGDTSKSSYQAGNTIHSGGDGMCWGNENPEDSNLTTRETNNVNMWIRYLEQMRDANNALGGGSGVGSLRGTISRNLVGLRVAYNWSGDQIYDYVAELCSRIHQGSGLLDRVAGWYFADEAFARGYSQADFELVALKVHQAQKSQYVNFPFYWTEPIFSYSDPPNLARDFWVVQNSVWVHRVPDLFKQWANFFFPDNGGNPDLADAVLVFLPFYYPWGSLFQDWQYRDHVNTPPFNDILPDNPPWKNWSTFMNSLRQAFPKQNPSPPYYPANKMRFRPIIEASHQQPRGRQPNHADLHKSIRVLLELKKQWNQSLSDERFDALWFIGWNQTGKYDYPVNCEQTPQSPPCEMGNAAWQRWTDPPYYAEAIQNEIGGQTETISDAWKVGNTVIATGLVLPPDPDQRIEFYFYGSSAEDHGVRIKYRLAPPFLGAPLYPGRPPIRLGESLLGQRHKWEIRIVSTATGLVVRTINEGFSNPSPHGRFESDVLVDQATWDSNPFFGTSAFWDGRNDSGNMAPVGDYDVYLWIEDPIAVEWIRIDPPLKLHFLGEEP